MLHSCFDCVDVLTKFFVPSSNYCRFGKSLRDIGIGSNTKKKSLSQRMLQSNNSKLFSSSAKMEIMQLLEEWEEPDIKTNSASKLKIKDVLQFRQAVAMMDDTYPFTPGELQVHLCVHKIRVARLMMNTE